MDQRVENEDGKKNIWVFYSVGVSFKGVRCFFFKIFEDYYWEGGGSDVFLQESMIFFFMELVFQIIEYYIYYVSLNVLLVNG